MCSFYKTLTFRSYFLLFLFFVFFWAERDIKGKKNYIFTNIYIIIIIIIIIIGEFDRNSN